MNKLSMRGVPANLFPARPVRFPAIAALLVAGLGLGACSQQQNPSATSDASAPAAPAAASSASDRVTEDLGNYRQLMRVNNDQLAVTLGQDILSRYPGSDAAKEVQQTLPAIEQRYHANGEKNRLAALWVYQTSPMEGGIQSTATIYSSQPSGNDRVRLVLRRHTSWGQSVFLFGSGKGFVCKGVCTIAATYDGKLHPLKAFLPPTGEPAIFIKDDPAFVASLPKVKRIVLPVTLKDGDKKQELVYEVGGYDPAKWVTVNLGKKK